MKRIGSRVITAFLVFTLCLGLVLAAGGRKVCAANFQFITGISLAYGENAYEELEEAGFRVMSVGLNYGVEDAEQIYLGYRINEGAPVTNIVITPNVGDGFVSAEGIQYQSAGGIDVDMGTGASGGVLYYTTDPAAGEPLVGLDILRQDVADGGELLAIPNDGSEIVRNAEGVPVDLEAGNGGVIIYLAQIRDHIVRPYIREIVTVSDTDRQSAVFQAAVQGYNYFIDGDIDENASTFTILAYERTANPDEAITNIVGVSEDLRKLLEEKQVKPGSEESGEKTNENDKEQTEESEAVSEEAEEEKTVGEPKAAEPEEATVEEPETAEPEAEATAEESETAEAEEAAEESEAIEAEAKETAGESEAAEAEETAGEPEAAEAEAEETAAESEAVEPEAEEAPEETETAEPEEEETAEEPEIDEYRAETGTALEYTPDTEEDYYPEETKEPEVRLTAEALDISGIEYVCVNKEPIPGIIPWNLYVTHDSKAGNPITMLYAEIVEGGRRTFFGMWADGFFAAKGTTRAYTYVVNEDLLAELQSDRTVYAELPVLMFNGSWDEQNKKVNVEVWENAAMLSLLTQNDGLPEDRLEMNGLKELEEEAPVIDRVETDSEQSGITSTAFEDRGNKFLIIGLIIGIAMAVSAAAVVLGRKKKEKDARKKKGGDKDS